MESAACLIRQAWAAVPRRTMRHSGGPMNKYVRTLIAGAVLLLACAPLYYTTYLFNPYLRAHGAVGDAPGFGSDLYPSWVGIRAIFNHKNPYSEAISNSIQAGYYGHVLR